jgi:hypothetical protein
MRDRARGEANFDSSCLANRSFQAGQEGLFSFGNCTQAMKLLERLSAFFPNAS